jgi:hypothetical protein
MLVAAVILAAGTLSLLYVVVRRQKAKTRVWVAAIALGIALGLSVGAFLRGIRGSSQEPEEVVAQAEPGGQGTAAGQGEPLAEDATEPAARAGVATVQPGAEPAADDRGGTAEAEPEAEATAVGEPEVAGAAEPEVSVEPGAESSRGAVRAWGREVRAVTTDPKRCKDPKELARMWASRPMVGPDHPEHMRAHIATNWLERCRSGIAEELARRIQNARREARREFAQTVRGRLHEKGEFVKVGLEGRGEASLRITGGSFDEASAKALLDSGLRDELADLGFVRVTFARYTQRHRFRIDPRPVSEVVAKDLGELGIGATFEL